MLCFWGAQVREGFGLVQPDKVKHGNSGIRSVCPKSKVQDMSAGRSFVGFIRDGQVSVLRLRSEDCDHDGKLTQLQLKNDRIRLILCGGDGAVLLAYGGKVLIMDKSIVCRPLKGLDNRQVIQIACGDHHSMALTTDGQLLVWGENSHGQLGLEKDHPGSSSAQHVQSLSGIPLAQISAGGDHSFGLSLSGVVFGWGKNSAGQLGLGDTTDRHIPTVVNSLHRKKTVSISCGGEHTATLSKGGTVFTFGSGGSGQLGHKSFKDEHHPRVVAELWGSEVSQVTCGRHHTLVSVASSKLIYSFGCGMQGQLGNGKIINKSVPFPVNLPTECNHDYTIEKLIAGENHSFALFFKEPGNESKPNPSRGILTLDDRMIDRWLSGSDPWKVVKKNINKVFSSAASLNGSFLKTSCDEHYQTSEDHCGLDFDLVKTSFAKLSKNERSISEVVKVVQQMLPSLNPNPAGVESLRVYLLLPELIRHLQEQQRTELTEALASKILQLNPDARKVLEMNWSKLPDDCLKGLVKLFKKASANLIGRMAADTMNWDIMTRLPKFVQILQMVYQVCCRANRSITKSDFIINEINDLLDVVRTKKWCIWLSVEKEKYFLFGILCGLAFNNTSVVHLPFPLALFKKLLNVKPSLEDLIEFSPVLDEKCYCFYFNFCYRTDFVDKYVDYILNKSVEEAFEEFKRGFFKACDRCMVEMFEPEELRGVLVGNEEYDWDILKQNTTYEGSFYAKHPTIISFWEVFEELTPNEKKAFLLFLTGFEKVPILGMSAVKMRVRPLFSFTQDHLPQALTCHSLLDLPVYQNKETLKAKVIEAINHKRGFWEE
uniref:Probable E3 ubiquitin-protein ligase HERC4 n=1 Tax=Sinocyclocheilus anshuiensis TaxID=1608454 RepID=A0A671SII6_9TELE